MSWLLIPLLKNAILVAPLALLALGVGRWSKRPALAHLLWVLVLIKLLTPPIIDVPLGWRLDVEAWLGAGQVAPQKSGMTAANQSSSTGRKNLTSSTSKNGQLEGNATRTSRRRPNLAAAPVVESNPGAKGWLGWVPPGPWRLQLLGFIWLGGSLVVAATMALQAWRFHRYLCRSARPHETLGPRVGDLAQEAQIGISPQVVVIEGVMSPALWTLGRRACLIFPARLADRLRPKELDTLLLHELSHFARGDHWVRVLELAARVIFWWHPVVWLARRELEEAEEQCCDAWVVEHQRGARQTYAEALLATIDFLHEPAPALPPAACGLGDVPLLKARLIQIMRGNVASRLSRGVTTLVLIAGLLISPLEPALWARSSASNPAPAKELKTSAPAPQPRVRISASRLRSQDATKSSSSNSPALTGSASTSAPPAPPRVSPLSPPAALWASAISSSGKYRLEARTGRRTTLSQTDSDFRLDMTAHLITCAAFARDSATFVTGHEDAIVRRWDSQTGGLNGSYKGCQSVVTSVQLSPDGRFLAAGTRDGTVLVWDVASAEETARFDSPSPISCIRWSSRGDKLAIVAGQWSQRESAVLYLWSPHEDVVLTEQSLPEPAGAIDWLANDDALVIAAWSGETRTWIVETKEFGQEIRLQKDQVSAAAWSPDCSLVNAWLAEQLSAGAAP